MSFSVLVDRSSANPDTTECAEQLRGLGTVISKAWGLQCGTIAPHGDQILCVVTKKPALRHADITVVREESRELWFAWVKDGSTIGPVSEIEDAADAVAAWLCRPVTAEVPEE
jgi:hypothetical protein